MQQKLHLLVDYINMVVVVVVVVYKTLILSDNGLNQIVHQHHRIHRTVVVVELVFEFVLLVRFQQLLYTDNNALIIKKIK